MKVVTAAEMREIDKSTIDGIGISGVVLMETAGNEIVRCIERHYPNARRFGIFVGKGNNGGDGLVIARQLAHKGYIVTIFLVSPAESFTDEALKNLDIVRKLGLHIEEISIDNPLSDGRNQDIFSQQQLNSIENCDLLIDAILGIGLRCEVREPISRIINEINSVNIPILSVDLPSGLDADTGHPLGLCIQADTTVTIGLPKRGLLLPPGAQIAGKLDIVEIGFPKKVIDAQKIMCNWTTEQDGAKWLPTRSSDTHKGSYGRVLVVAGSTGMTGAAALTSEAALKTGAGLVTLAIPKSLNAIVEVKLSEVMTLPLAETEAGSLAESATEQILDYATKHKSIIAIGPGLSQHPETVALVHQLISRNKNEQLGLRFVIDADGLNALAQKKELIHLLDNKAVLTPHLGEMARLINYAIDELTTDRIRVADEFTQKYGVTLVLKGAPTIVSHPNGEKWINSTGNPGMATAGMGDVLTGIIAGLIAQHVESQTAATLGVYIHGLAGDIAAGSVGMHGLIASDVLNVLPQTITSLIHEKANL